MDPGRKADMELIDAKRNDPNVSKYKRHMLDKARAAISEQSHNPKIQELRGQLHKAIQAGDQSAMDKLNRQLDIIDKGGTL